MDLISGILSLGCAAFCAAAAAAAAAQLIAVNNITIGSDMIELSDFASDE